MQKCSLYKVLVPLFTSEITGFCDRQTVKTSHNLSRTEIKQPGGDRGASSGKNVNSTQTVGTKDPHMKPKNVIPKRE